MAKFSGQIAKLTRPQAAGLLERERLFSLLDSAHAARCAWVSAPAGSGKTSLVSSWIEARGLGCAWYEADAGDADPATFFHYLRLAGIAAAGKRRVELPHLTPEYMPGIAVFARRFFEHFFDCLKPPFVLVLDNYQAVPPEAVFHTLVDGALHALPAGGQLICISREAPPGAFARWRADAGFQSVGWDEIKFTDDEARSFARLAGGEDEADAIGMNRRARGWVAGLKLMLQAEAGGTHLAAPDKLAPQTLFDYFAAEVFDRAQPALHDFLLKTALLPSMSADVAHRISGHDDARKTLASLHRGRLFTERHARPGAEDAYEYHPLFREFLLRRAQSEFTGAAFLALQRHAAQLLEEAGQVEAAAALSIGTGDWPSLERLICRHAPALVSEARFATLEPWIQAMPNAMRDASPWLLFWQGTCRGLRDPVQARPSLALAYAQFKATGEMTGAFLALVGIIAGYFHQWTEMETLDHWIAQFEQLLEANGGNLPPAAEVRVLGSCYGLLFRRPDHPVLRILTARAEQLVRTLPDPSERFEVAVFLSHCLHWSGEFGRTEALAEEFHGTADARVSVWHRIQLGLLVGCNRFQQAQHEAAVEALDAVLELARESGIHLMNGIAYAHLAFAWLSAGDADAAERALDAGRALVHPSRLLDVQHYRFLRAGCLLARGRVKEALALARDAAAPQIGMGAPFGEATFRIQLGQMLMLDGQHDEAREHLERALDFATRMPSAILEFQTLMALAWSCFDRGEDANGLDALRRGLTIGSRQNYMNCHPWWIPKVMARLCARALEANIETDYVQRLIRVRRLLPPEDGRDLAGWPWPIRIHTLGRFALVIANQSLKSPSKAQKKPLELLKALVAQGGRSIVMAALAAQLWPDLDGDAGQNALNAALHRLRRLLGDEDALLVQEGKLTLDARRLWVDAWAFERLVGQAERCVQCADDCKTSTVQTLATRLLALYPGHFLLEEEAPWAIGQRERLRSKFLRTGAVLGSQLESGQQYEQAADLYRRALEQDALAESFHCGLMRCLQALGRSAEALAAYRRCTDILRATLGVAPGAQMQALYRALKA